MNRIAKKRYICNVYFVKHRHAVQTRNTGKTKIRHKTLKDMETLNDVGKSRFPNLRCRAVFTDI